MIRPAVPADAAGILALIRDLAAYEREPDAVAATVADVEAALAGEHPVASALVAESTAGAVATGEVGVEAVGAGEVGAGEIVGLALWFRTFSTWTGQAGMWLEDLYVRPDHRRSGTGRRLLQALAAHCVAQGWPRLEWTVLDWNTPAQAFYASLGATPLTDWTTNRVSGAALAALAAPVAPAVPPAAAP